MEVCGRNSGLLEVASAAPASAEIRLPQSEGNFRLFFPNGL